MGAPRLGQILAALIVSTAPVTASECVPNHVGADVCEFAKKVQSEMASILPQRISQNVTIVNATVVGPLLTMSAQWNFTLAQIDTLISKSGKTKDQFMQAIDLGVQRSICADERTAAFVRLGGKVQHIYRTTDSFTVRVVTVENCPRTQNNP